MVVDDLYHEACDNEAFSRAITNYRRKRKFSIVLISQYFFDPGKYGRTIRTNFEVRSMIMIRVSNSNFRLWLCSITIVIAH